MEKTGRKAFSLLLAVAMVLSMLPINVFAAEQSSLKLDDASQRTAEFEDTTAPELGEAVVNDWLSLKNAVDNPSISSIRIASDIELKDALTLRRNIEFVSNDETQSFSLYSAIERRHFIVEPEGTTQDYKDSNKNSISVKFKQVELNCKN